MPVKIKDIEPKSIAGRAGINDGDTLISINGRDILDFLDYNYYAATEKLSVKISDEQGKEKTYLIKKGEYEDLGLIFDTWLIDSERRCRNNCMFCFIDQLPEGLRETLYFKDDDERLGFLYGNYITLTNLSEHDMHRIIDMKLSPVNISVHTMNPALRCEIMGSRFAGDALRYIDDFAASGTAMNFQLVLMPGINDGEELFCSLEKLTAIESVLSIAVVPVGLTKHREGLVDLTPFTKTGAKETLDIIEKFGNYCLNKYGRRTCYASDEFYILAEEPIPEVAFYEGFAQLENGVGLIADFNDTFSHTLNRTVISGKPRTVSIVTGTMAAEYIKAQVDNLIKKWHNLNVHVYGIENNFFGEKITVAGLITAGDIMNQLSGKELGERLLIPACMLRREGDCFLDDITVEELSKRLNVHVEVCQNDGSDLIRRMVRNF